MNINQRFTVNGQEFSSYVDARTFAQLQAELKQQTQTVTVTDANGSVLWADSVHPVVQFHGVQF